MKTFVITVGAMAILASVGIPQSNGVIELPQPTAKSETSLEESIAQRRSVRQFTDEALTLQDVSQLLWAGQGITDKGRELRAAPSAGALYPLELLIVVRNVDGLKQGAYRYLPRKHALRRLKTGELSTELARAALGQRCVREAPLVIAVNGILGRTQVKYGERSRRYMYIEAGCATENILLQAVSMKLGAVVVGAFYDSEVARVVSAGKSEEPLALICVGKPKK